MSSSPARRSRIEVEEIEDVTVVKFVEKMVLDDAFPVSANLFHLVDDLGRRKLLLNLSNVEFWSSSMLGKLIALHRKLQAAQGVLVLCNVNEDILEVFKTTKVDKIFTVVPDQQSGLRSF